MEIRKIIRGIINEQLGSGYKVVDKGEFVDRLLDLATLNLEDGQVRYPKSWEDENHLFGGKDYDLYVINREELPSSGPFEIVIKNDDEDIIGFIRGNKSGDIVSFNLIHIKEEHRGSGIGADIYEKFLEKGYVIKSDDEITDSTYSLYEKLRVWGYKPLIFDDGRVGLKK